MPEEFTLSPREEAPKGSEDHLAALKCGLCFTVMTSPVMASCRDCFCAGCWEEYVAERQPGEPLECPTCHVRLKGDVINVMTHPKGQGMRNRLLQAPRECIHDGCTWTGPYGAFLEHVDRCPRALQQCRFPGCGVSLPRSEVVAHEERCIWRTVECQYCASPVPLRALAEHGEQVQISRCELRSMQERLCRLEAAVEKCAARDDMDAKLDAITQDSAGKLDPLSLAVLRLDKRLKRLEAERRHHQSCVQQDVLDKVQRDLNVALYQGLQDKARAAEVYRKADTDMLVEDLHDQVALCHRAQQRLCRVEDHEVLCAQVSQMEAELRNLGSGLEARPSSFPSSSAKGAGPRTRGDCINWSIAEAMGSIARGAGELAFASFGRVSSSVFDALDLRGLRLAFVRKRTAAPGDLPKSWCYLHAPRGTSLDWVMTVGDEERRFAHEFETSRSFGGVFHLPFTSEFTASDLHEGILVQTRYEGKDGRQSAHALLACVLELNNAETMNGACRKVVWVAFPDGSKQAVELYWITCVQKIPQISVTINHARQNRYFGSDISVTFSMTPTP
mmetsp:Transcript_13730/g.39177  ORF Transcript_13730/g.39177 Transcript_13730/m.39177 type:complete len:560 (-) Transcript_13730:79-1758(-)